MGNKGGIPLYIKVTDLIKKDIASGRYLESESIGTQSELCERYGVSMITVRRALDILAEDGLIETKQGKGTFVKNAKRIDSVRDLNELQKTISGHGLSSVCRLSGFGVVDTPERFSDDLKKEFGARCLRFTRTMSIEGVDSVLDVTYLHEKYAKLVSEKDLEEHLMYYYFRTRFGMVPGRAEQELSVSYADADLAKALGIAEGTPVFVMKQKSYDVSGRFMEYMEDFCEATAYTFTVTVDLSGVGKE